MALLGEAAVAPARSLVHASARGSDPPHCVGATDAALDAPAAAATFMHHRSDFDTLLLPHLDAAYNLARWLLRDAYSAEDAVQDAYLRAWRYFASFRGGDARPWLLGIVRTQCFERLAQDGRGPRFVSLDDEHAQAAFFAVHDLSPDSDPARAFDGKRTRERIDAALRSLAPPFREVIVLRELEGLSYEAIAEIAALPLGTVMSRLSRARAQLRAALGEQAKEG